MDIWQADMFLQHRRSTRNSKSAGMPGPKHADISCWSNESMLMRRIKLLEIGLMLIAAIAFTTKSYLLLLFVLFLMGCQSSLFGPVKYAYLPQRLAVEELVGGNALVEAGTYTAILACWCWA